VQGNRIVGLVLIAVGTGLFLVTATGLGGELFLGVLGAGFLVGYALSRTYGLLIPGMILVGLSAGIVAEGLGAPNEASAIGLGLGFVGIAVVDRLLGSVGPGWWWPLIPGGILTVSGLATVTGVERLGPYVFPIVLVIAGVVLISGRRRRAPSPPTVPSGPVDAPVGAGAPPPPPPGTAPDGP
jgi:hypothetical protein